jgi:hypothetical protein
MERLAYNFADEKLQMNVGENGSEVGWGDGLVVAWSQPFLLRYRPAHFHVELPRCSPQAHFNATVFASAPTYPCGKLPRRALQPLISPILFSSPRYLPQAHFNATVFASALADYEREGIPLPGISLPDNTPIMDLFDARPHGIFHLLQVRCQKFFLCIPLFSAYKPCSQAIPPSPAYS